MNIPLVRQHQTMVTLPENKDITQSFRIVHLPDCFSNAMNVLVATTYYTQMKDKDMTINDEIINFMCDKVKEIIEGGRSFRKSTVDKINVMSMYRFSKRHKYIRIGIRDAIRCTSYLTFRDFYNEFTKINGKPDETNLFTFPIDEYKIIIGDNGHNPHRTTKFISIYETLLKDLDKIPTNYSRRGKSYVNVDIPPIPKIKQMRLICFRYLERTKSIRGFFRALEKLIHQEIQDGTNVSHA